MVTTLHHLVQYITRSVRDRSRVRAGEGPRAPAAAPPAAGAAEAAAARHLGDGDDLRRRRRHQGAHPRAAHRALQHGRHAHQLPRGGT